MESNTNSIPVSNGQDETLDPFDPAKLRLNVDFAEAAGVKKLLVTVPVKKPNRQEFVKVNADPEYRGQFGMIELKEDREIFLVSPDVAQGLRNEIGVYSLYTAINRQGVVFLWPVRLPESDGKTNAWNESAAQAATHAMTKWLRVTSNRALGAYEIFVAEAPIPEPEWPEQTYSQLLAIAFGSGRLITSLDHHVVLRLRGLA